MMKYIIPIFLVFSIALAIYATNRDARILSTDQETIRYVAIGDSYSNGEGAARRDAWPSLLADQLREQGVKVELVANPSVTGWTSRQAIDRELAVFDRARPGFATLQIGVNDWVQGVDSGQFRSNIATLIERMQQRLGRTDRLIIVTIPDFSATPKGPAFGRGRDITTGISEFNAILTQEAAGRGVPIVDIFPISRGMKTDAELVAPDGLHPTAKEYALWADAVFPVAYKLLAK